MPVVLCPDTRKLAPEDARKVWWELAIWTTPTRPLARQMGWGPLAYVVSGMVFGDADKIPGVLQLCEVNKSFRSEGHALELVTEHADRLKALPRLCGSAAASERSRVWRVG